MTKTILVIGTYDTKNDELSYLCQTIIKQGGAVISMDVSVLGDPMEKTDISKHDVAAAAGKTIEDVINAGDENLAMQIMAAGASALTTQLYADGKIDAMVGLGGSMGTDLVLDCCQALPLGMPKYVVSTIAFSPLIPPERLSPDVQMILWAGGLYGLNSICKSSLSQAAGAVLGAAQAVEPPIGKRPLIGMMSLGSSCLKYMTYLQKPLEERGFEVAVFHATGMGGMAFEALARQHHFVCVLDLALPEISNLMVGSVANAGRDRLTNAGLAGIPQIISPGCADLIDFAGWQDIPDPYKDRPFHAHNRLIKSAGLSSDERRAVIRDIAARLATAKGAVKFVMPLKGIEEWDQEGEPAYDPDGLAAMIDEVRQALSTYLVEIDAHINSQAYADLILQLVDEWVEAGVIKTS